MAKYITEVLKEINDDVSLFYTVYKKQGDGGPLGIIFKHAFLPESKFLLPEGKPPFKPDAAPIGMSPSRFIQEVRKFNLFMRTDLKPVKREQLFIQLCESIHPEEAAILLAIKEQNLNELYPNITWSVVSDAGFIPPPTEEQLANRPKPKKTRASRKKKDSEAIEQSADPSD